VVISLDYLKTPPSQALHLITEAGFTDAAPAVDWKRQQVVQENVAAAGEENTSLAISSCQFVTVDCSLWRLL